MSDPLDALHEPVRPVDPDPAFAARLRARLEREVLAAPRLPREEALTSTISRGATLALHSITPYIAVPDAAAALDFYVEAFGAVRRGDPIVMPDGRIGHAEVAIGDSVLMLAEQFPEMGIVAPREGESPASMRLEVPDPDTVVDRAVELGARLERPVSDSPYGRGGVVVDPAGHRWMVSREAPSGRPLQVGDVGYASLWRPDVVAAERFYGAVLGWTVEGDHSGQGRRITGTGQHLGMYGGQESSTTLCCYAVPDVDATVALVRAAGGTAEEPTDEPFGRTASCVDDQGGPFAVFAPEAGSRHHCDRDADLPDDRGARRRPGPGLLRHRAGVGVPSRARAGRLARGRAVRRRHLSDDGSVRRGRCGVGRADVRRGRRGGGGRRGPGRGRYGRRSRRGGLRRLGAVYRRPGCRVLGGPVLRFAVRGRRPSGWRPRRVGHARFIDARRGATAAWSDVSVRPTRPWWTAFCGRSIRPPAARSRTPRRRSRGPRRRREPGGSPSIGSRSELVAV